MKQLVYIFFLLLGSSYTAFSQQIIQTEIPNIIELKFTSTETTSGDLVILPFSTPASFNTGITSFAEELTVNSNNNFNVSVKTNSANFTYTGTEIANTTMPASKLLMAVTSNATGGAIGSGFTSPSYKALGTSNASLITGGLAGPDQLFTIRYKTIPGYSYAGGTYTIDVVFTATQP
ncbi:MAG: hypothetical protein EOP49_48550 [Sphingobacteriales bacterium]|nr:MAG: hypothetical protein EOP49_48550 [Sphingobacteriales bacterium]